MEEYVEDPEEQELLRQRRQLFRKIVIGDGACVFRSVSDQMYQSQFWYGDVHESACDQVKHECVTTVENKYLIYYSNNLNLNYL